MTAYICPECGGFMNGRGVCQGCGAEWIEDHSEGPDFDGEVGPEIAAVLAEIKTLTPTPGPWGIAEDASSGHIFGPDTNTLASVYYSDYKIGQGRANARLIAAAPELLEACKQAYLLLLKISPRYMPSASGAWTVMQQLLSASAKAEGHKG